jgi:osmotically-inducible protein OsmY
VARIQASRAAWEQRIVSGRMASRSRHLRNRMRGRIAEAQAALRDEPASDEILIERIRAQIGHCSDHPRNILVTVQDGMVTVAGPILAREVDAVISCVQGVRGVRGVTNCLEVYRHPASLPVLQD